MIDTFGEWLRGERNTRRLTREQFAQRVGCSVAALRKIEDDERRPSVQIAELMANALEVPVADRDIFIRVARGEWGIERLPGATDRVQRPIPTFISTGLPVLPTPLIGRQHELEQLHQLLRDPQCRILTLVGQGGIGKTRLAIEAATQAQGDFADGAYFVPLAPVNSAQSIVPVIADSIGFMFKSTTVIEPKEQLLSYLERKCLLLLLDNIEHLLEDPEVELLPKLVERSPRLKLLLTSREPINLHGEWVVDIHGLPIPEGEDTQGTSIELFLQRARRARVSFNATADDIPTIRRICKLVEGVPLGIELAAAWVRTLSCNEIADEIEHGLDFLHASARDLPARHRSMRAVFEHSWKLLSEDERSVLAQLSVFQGGFTRQAAEQITGANLFTLSGLVSKSILRRGGDGRYDLHELIKQFAAERLAEEPHRQKELQERHGRYFMEYFGRQDARLRGPEQQMAIAALSDEMDNFRVAWAWSIDQKEFDLIQQILRAFETFFDARGWLHEGLGYLTDALNALDHSGREYPLLTGHILIGQSLLLFRLARMDQALTNLERGLQILRPLNQPSVLVEGVTFLGIVFAMMGKYADALPLFYEGLELARASGDQWFEALSMTEIVSIEIMAGEADDPYRKLQGALAAWRATGDPRFTAFGLNSLSLSAVRLGRLDEARAALEESIAINQSVGDRWGLGTAYRGLGLVEEEQGRHGEAVEAFKHSQTILTDLGAGWDVARVLGDMGRSVFALEKLTEAEGIWREAIHMAVGVQGTPLMLESIVGIGNVRVRQGDLSRAYEFFQVVANHPASVQETRSRATKALRELEGRLTRQELESIQAGSGGATLDAIVEGILHSV